VSSMHSQRSQAGLKGVQALAEYLDRAGVAYEVVEHEKTFTALTEASASGVAPVDVAKTVVLRDDSGYRLAIIPASDHLDLHKMRELLGQTTLRLATEQEMGGELGPFEVGALPPVGSIISAPEVFDRHLLDHKRILCSGGDHRHSVLIDPKDLVGLSRAQVADICQD
jgi:Ala-tRNA(Pro) deacylase